MQGALNVWAQGALNAQWVQGALNAWVRESLSGYKSLHAGIQFGLAEGSGGLGSACGVHGLGSRT